MSYDLFVYSENEQAVSRAELTAAMHAVGWDILFIDDYFKMSVAQGERVSRDEFAIGWQSDPAMAAKVKGLFAHRDLAGLEALFEEMTVSGCEISAGAHKGIEDEEGIPDDIRPHYRRALGQAKTYYYLRTAAGRSPMASIFQEALWQTIGNVTRGLVENSRSGGYCFARELPPPKTIAEAISAFLPKPPTKLIDWYGGLALLSLFLAITGKIPIITRPWYLVVMCVYGLLAYGISLGHKWVWQVAAGLSVVFIVLGGYGGLLGGLGSAALPIIAYNAYFLYLLLSFDTRLYCDAV